MTFWRFHAPAAAGRRGLAALAAACLWAAAFALAAAQPYVASDYRGDPESVLAWINEEPVTEADLYLFLLMMRHPAPDFPRNWRDRAPAAASAPLRARIREAVELYAQMKLIAAREAAPASPFVESLARRWILYPVYALVWTDEVVDSYVQVLPEDITYYIQRNPAEFSSSARTQFYWAWFSARLDEGPDARSDARARAEALLLDLRRGGVTSLGTLAQDYPPSTTLRAENGLYTIFHEEGMIDPLIEAALRLNPVGQISEVVETRDGFHLVEPRVKVPASLRPREEIESEARRALQRHFLPLQYNYLLDRLARGKHPVSRIELWPFLAEDTVLLAIGPYLLTKGEFRETFLALLGQGGGESAGIAALREISSQVVSLELVAQDVEARSLTLSPPLASGFPLAETLLRAHRALSAAKASEITLSDEELDAAWEQWRDSIRGRVERHYFRLEASLKSKGGILPAAEEQRTVFEKILRDTYELRRAASEAMRGASLLGAPGAPLNENLTLARWDETSEGPYLRRHEDLGFLPVPEPGAIPLFKRNLPLLAPGEVSAPRYEAPGVVALYFVTAERPLPEPSVDERRALVRDFLRIHQPLLEARERLGVMRNEGRFRWDPALEP